MSRLEDYVIHHSSCSMPRCEYIENDMEIDCDKCQKLMIEEHDKQVRQDAIEELGNVLCNELDNGYIFMNKHQILHFVKQLKEKNNGNQN